MILFIIIFIIVIIFIIINHENFSEIKSSSNIDYNVIHLINNEDRKQNIIINEIKLGKKINIFNAINGKDIDINKLNTYDKNIKLNNNNMSNSEIGCYLSHLILIKKASMSKKKYTVIFEDDFKIMIDDLDTEINNIVGKINDFSFIFLGNLYDSKSDKIIDNIYIKNNLIPLYGCHAILINNIYANDIYKNLLNITYPIDIALDKLSNYYVIYPSLVIQDAFIKSTLRSQLYIYRRSIIQNIIKFYYNII